MRGTSVTIVSILLLGFSATVYSQTDVEADPAHHKLEFENKCVRVVRVTFGPGEKSAGMFDAKDVVIVTLAGGRGLKLNLPDGKSVDTPATKTGQVGWVPGGRIQPENTSKEKLEFIVIEPKGCS